MNNMYIPGISELSEKIASIEDMPRIIGTNLKRARQARGFSLDEVSIRSSVSKSMLSDIERGRKCPTVSVLCKICEGINVSIPSLMRSPEKLVTVVKDGETVSCDGAETQTLFKFDLNASLEIHKTHIGPGKEFHGEAHGEKVWEYILVLDGVFTLELDNDVYEIGKGGSIRFLANMNYTYANRTGEDLTFFNVTYHED